MHGNNQEKYKMYRIKTQYDLFPDRQRQGKESYCVFVAICNKQ